MTRREYHQATENNVESPSQGGARAQTLSSNAAKESDEVEANSRIGIRLQPVR
jgi:hypothetical protein